MDLTTKDILLITFRTYFIRLFYNYRFLFGHGLCFCMLPYGKKRKFNTEKTMQFIHRHICFFNSNEYVVGFAIGIFLKLEMEENYNKIDNVKKVFSSTLGAVGDNLVYKLITPVLMLGLLNTFIFYNFKFNITIIYVAAAVLILFNLFNFGIRFYGIKNGFLYGIKALKFTKNKKFIKFEKGINLFKFFLLGCTTVNLLNTLQLSEKFNNNYIFLTITFFFVINLKKSDTYKFVMTGLYIIFFLLTIYCFLPKQ